MKIKFYIIKLQFNAFKLQLNVIKSKVLTSNVLLDFNMKLQVKS